MNRRYFKYFLLSLFLVCVFSALPVFVHAQGVGDPGCDTLDPACPIDGGLAFLLAAGVAYGIKKAGHFRKKGAATT